MCPFSGGKMARGKDYYTTPAMDMNFVRSLLYITVDNISVIWQHKYVQVTFVVSMNRRQSFNFCSMVFTMMQTEANSVERIKSRDQSADRRFIYVPFNSWCAKHLRPLVNASPRLTCGTLLFKMSHEIYSPTPFQAWYTRREQHNLPNFITMLTHHTSLEEETAALDT